MSLHGFPTKGQTLMGDGIGIGFCGVGSSTADCWEGMFSGDLSHMLQQKKSVTASCPVFTLLCGSYYHLMRVY